MRDSNPAIFGQSARYKGVTTLRLCLFHKSLGLYKIDNESLGGLFNKKIAKIAFIKANQTLAFSASVLFETELLKKSFKL